METALQPSPQGGRRWRRRRISAQQHQAAIAGGGGVQADSFHHRVEDFLRTHRSAVGWILGAAIVIGMLHVFPTVSVVLSNRDVGFTLDRYEEVVLQPDPKNRKYGFQYTEDLTVKSVERGSPADVAGMGRFIGRRLRRANGISVVDSGDLSRAIIARERRTVLARHLVLDFVPEFRVGAAVRALQRLSFKSSPVVPPGALGIVLRVPGATPGSVAQVRIRGVRFDAQASQVEPVVEEDSVPKRFDRRPGWIMKSRGREDVEEVIKSLGYAGKGYLEKMLPYGLDRMDTLAAAGHAEAGALGILPLHFSRMVDMAVEVVRKRRRLIEQHVAEELQAMELWHLSELESEARRKAYDDAGRSLNDSLPASSSNATAPTPTTTAK